MVAAYGFGILGIIGGWTLACMTFLTAAWLIGDVSKINYRAAMLIMAVVLGAVIGGAVIGVIFQCQL